MPCLVASLLMSTAPVAHSFAATVQTQQAQSTSVEADLGLWKELTDKQAASTYDFSTIASFIARHPDWPAQKTLRLNAERSLDGGVVGTSLLRGFFENSPPLTPEGLAVYAAELAGQGRAKEVTAAIRDFWRTGTMTATEQRTFATRWARYLTADDFRERASTLVWQDDLSLAKTLLPTLDDGSRKLIAARITMRENPGQANSALSTVPAHLMDDAGLTYDRLRWRIKADQEPSAIELLVRASLKPDAYAAAWWKQRDYLLHYALKDGQKDAAYAIASHHSFVPADGVAYAEAEWAAGWIALRFLNNPSKAAQHFNAMYSASRSMILKAKGAYWMGRTATALSQLDTAKKWYEKAAENSVTFYGQLAAVEAYGAVNISVPATSKPEASAEAAFNRKSLVRAVRFLTQSGERDLADRFFKALTESIASQAEASATILLGHELGRADYAVLAGKTAGRLGYAVGAEAYPTLRSVPSAPAASFIHAIIRQESMFNPRALSTAGAMGLMQLMPATAKIEAGKMGVAFTQSKLFEPTYNAQLGSAYLARLMERFDGAEVYAAAGYNAGPNRIDTWRDDYGDPHAIGSTNPLWKTVDWIELIPFNETRSYVMRVLEAVSIYDARLSKQPKVALSIKKNLMP